MPKKIKVLQLGSPSGLYGAEHWILALIKHLDKSKIEIWVGSILDKKDMVVPICVEAEKSGFQTKIIEAKGRFNFSAVRKLRTLIQKNCIDVLHTHGYKTDIIGLLAVKGTRCKLVTTPHGWTEQPDLKLFIYEVIDRLIFSFFDAVVPLSEALVKTIDYIPGLKKKIRFIRNGVNIQEIESIENIAEEMKTWKKEGTLVLGYIGRLVPGKGIDTLLETVAKYGKPNWRVAIIGEGEQYHELKFMVDRLHIEKQVTFFGFRSDRLSFLKGFDIFILPSRSEGIPRCLMEAMSSNIPVIATDIPGCRYLVDGETTGLLFEVDQSSQLAEAIEKIDSKPSLKATLCLNGKKFVHKHYSAEKMAKEYEQLYLQLMN